MLAVDRRRRLRRLRVFVIFFGVQPLLELIEDDQHFCRRREPQPRRSAASVSTRLGRSANWGQRFLRPFSIRVSVSSAVELNVDGNRVVGQAGSKPALTSDDFRSPTVRRSGRWRRSGRLALLNARLPEANALGQAIAIARPGEQLEEEIGIVLVERRQSFGDDGEGVIVEIHTQVGVSEA